MLYEILRHIRNFFPADNGYHDGQFIITGGSISLPFLRDKQYFLIEGSVLNDGVYKYPATGLEDETFQGTITELRIPKDFLQLVKEIEDWQAKYGTKVGPYQSESFGGYSYSLATTGSGKSIGWKDAFAGRLNAWRKI